MTHRATVIGIDLGDRAAHLCVLSSEGDIVEESKLSLTRAALAHRFARLEPTRVVIEVGTHSRWVAAELAEHGHEVLVADVRQLALISASYSKSDRKDAELLARLGRADDLALLKPVKHRTETTHAALAVVRCRKIAVEARTKLVNAVRGQVKAMGHRLPSCSAKRFHTLLDEVPDELRAAVEPLMAAIGGLNATIAGYDAEIERLGREEFPEVQRLRQVPGVGALVALTFALIVEDASRFSNTRAVAAYIGLVPRRFQSGSKDPNLGITKAGDRYLRKLLTQSAHYVLGHFGPDSDLRRWGLERVERSNKRKAITAVARKLSVLLLTLWKTGADYDPFHSSGDTPPGPSSRPARPPRIKGKLAALGADGAP